MKLVPINEPLNELEYRWDSINKVRIPATNLMAPIADVLETNVIGLGSSSLKGEGASDQTNTSWMGLLTADLTARGIRVIKQGVGGDNTSGGLDRFVSNVAANRADICFIAFTLLNEGWVPGGDIGTNMTIYDQFKANLFQLIQKCRQYGIVPWVISQFPNDNYDADLLRAAKQLNRAVEKLGVPTSNFMGGLLDETTGKILAGAKADTYHHNDLGHMADYKSFNPSAIQEISALGYLPSLPNTFVRRGAVKYPVALSDAASGDAIMFVPEYDIDSFTVACRVKLSGTDWTSAKTLLGLGTAGWRVTTTNDTNQFIRLVNAANADVVVSTVSVNDNAKHSVAVTYNIISDKVRLYIDGVLIGSPVTAGGLSLTQVGVGCRGTGTLYPDEMEFWDVAVYRTTLHAQQVQAMHEGEFTNGSLELFCPMDDVAVSLYNRFHNYAPTNSKLKIKSNLLVHVAG